jgi:ABC-type sulfate transport system permease component
MNEIIYDVPLAVPTMVSDCLILTTKMNNAFFVNSKIIALCFGMLGLVLGGLLGYLVREKYGPK